MPSRPTLCCLLACLALLPALAVAAHPEPRTLTFTPQALEDKVRGGWAGQMIGVSYGSKYEFRSLGKTVDGPLEWKPENVDNSLKQDDLYVDMTFATVMDRHGLNAGVEQYGEALEKTEYPLWHANAAARRLLSLGIQAPVSGSPRYNVHANDIDFQIESDFIGLMTPGLPREAVKYCNRVGRVMNSGDGLYGGMFVTGMYAAAFAERDPRRIVEAGLACMPPKCSYAAVIRDVLRWSAENPHDWRKTWNLIEEKWDKNDSCPGGACQPFNIDARINGAYVAMGLLYGNGDFGKTMEVSIRCGQDADCNPSSAAGILGVVLGYSGIPDNWKSGIPAIKERKFQNTDYSYEEIVRSTLTRARKVVESTGGRWSDGEIRIRTQTPRPPKLEQWSMGAPDRIIQANAPEWSWSGRWKDEEGKIEYRTKVGGKATKTVGAEGTLHFTGTAVLLLGPHDKEGGRADVYLDEKWAGEIDAYSAKENTDEGLWHAYGLKPGPHVLRVVTRPDAHPDSKQKKLYLFGATVYR